MYAYLRFPWESGFLHPHAARYVGPAASGGVQDLVFSKIALDARTGRSLMQVSGDEIMDNFRKRAPIVYQDAANGRREEIAFARPHTVVFISREPRLDAESADLLVRANDRLLEDEVRMYENMRLTTGTGAVHRVRAQIISGRNMALEEAVLGRICRAMGGQRLRTGYRGELEVGNRHWPYWFRMGMNWALAPRTCEPYREAVEARDLARIEIEARGLEDVLEYGWKVPLPHPDARAFERVRHDERQRQEELENVEP